MSTQIRTPLLLRRVAARAGLGVWRHRGGVLAAAVVSVALGGYLALNGAPLSALNPVTGVGASADCADTAMAAIADKSPAAAQRAYQCMDPSFQQRVPEQAFVQQMQAQSAAGVKNLSRVGDYHPSAGGSMVYYALDTGGQSVGYIVYLGQDGKVLKIE
ncbi:MAG TPA: hypothetical protein VF937_00575 [Chloroflexota bacterium]